MRKRSKLLFLSVALALAPASRVRICSSRRPRLPYGISSSPESSSRSVTLVEVAPLSELRLSYLVTWKLWVACKLVFGLRDVFERLSVRRVASSLGLRKQVGWLLQFLSSSLSYLPSFTSLSPTLPRTYFVFPFPDRILRITRANTSPRSRIANSVGFGHKVFTHRLA